MHFVADIAYAARVGFKPCYYANDHARDTVVIDIHAMPITDGRKIPTALDREGFIIVPHHSSIGDFESRDAVLGAYPCEIEALLRGHTGADEVRITAPGIVRFSEKSGRAGSSDNSHPARFVHVDITDETARGFVEAAAIEKPIARYAHYNIWRAFSGAPQDVGLALCAANSLNQADLLVADAIFDPPNGASEWSFESWLLAYNPAHQWYAYPDMTRDEVIIFKTSDSQFHNPAPHVAFDNPLAPHDAPPRASIEMRALALWYT